jgi:cob(I)alamin adenosyltransferase
MVKLTKIYTRGGDAGETSLVDGSRLPKHALRISAFGTVDEANSAIGMVRLHTGAPGDAVCDAMLGRIQNDMFDLGADLATPGKVFDKSDPEEPAWVLRVLQVQVDRLETEIDALNGELAPLNSFVLPGGTPASAHLHLARTITRRAERLAVEANEQTPLNPVAIKYLNRLSDLLFVMGRYLNDKGAQDVLWVPGANR